METDVQSVFDLLLIGSHFVAFGMGFHKGGQR